MRIVFLGIVLLLSSPAAAEEPDAPPAVPTLGYAGLCVFATGLALTGVGLGYGFASKSKIADVTTDVSQPEAARLADEANELARTSNALLLSGIIVGVVGAGLTTFALLTHRARAGVVLTDDGAMASFHLSW